MKTSDQTDKLIPALLAARKAMSPAHKGQRNDHFKYTYANEEAWHDAVQPALQANDLLLTFSVESWQRAGNLTSVTGLARVTHVSGQWIEVRGVAEGEDKADKAAFKAQTGLKKYLYALAFGLPTTDDPEDDGKPKRAKVATVTGEAKTKQPAWTEEQKKRVGDMRGKLNEALDADTVAIADAEVVKTWRDMKYDEPEHVIEAIQKVVHRWLDINDAASAAPE
jgi:hypothetical protein